MPAGVKSEISRWNIKLCLNFQCEMYIDGVRISQKILNKAIELS